MQPPVIVVPGITASTLRDLYPMDPNTVWSTILNKEYDRIALHPDDLRYERDEPARVLADRLFGVPYANFIAELRHDLADHHDRPVPVFPFPYDWRLPLAQVQAQLTAFIGEVVERTRLMRHYHKDGYGAAPRVDLVGHSMGGLIITGCLAAGAGVGLIRKVATVATPFRGSFEAVLKVAVGTAELGPGPSNSREREVARLTPSLYHLIPSYEDAVIADRAAWRDLFRVSAWQPSVLATIGEYIRLFGLEPASSRSGRQDQARGILAGMLKAAGEHRATVEDFRLRDARLEPDDWLVIVGVGEETRTALRVVDDGRDNPFFDLDSAQRRNGYPGGRRSPDDGVVEQPWETGDGTVPYFGAKPSFIDAARIVALCDADFGYWELRDRVLQGVAGLHGMLPTMNVVPKLIAAHLHGKAGQPGRAHAGLWGRRAPDLPPGEAWRPPIRGLRERVA
ncbi:MAG: lipase family alpha/beta hydrolase [Longimicrobiales bacterium]